MSTLHIFDMDGTLLTGSACLDLSRHVGQIEAVDAMEAEWTLGRVGHVEFYEMLLPLWDGISEESIEEVFVSGAWIEGIPEVWADIADRGEHSAVISLSPQFYVERLGRWGLASAHGAQVQAGVAPDPAGVITPEAKVDIARSLMERLGVEPADTVAYGDSSSDLPLFEWLDNTVAVNASEGIREAAAASYEGNDLREAYELGRSLLAGARSAPGA